MKTLMHAELKAGRAFEHLTALRAELQRYYDSKPVIVTKGMNAEQTRRTIRLQVKSPEEVLYLIVGDFVHNLRSALDHVIYALVTHTLKAAPTSRAIQWPVLETVNAGVLARQTADLPAAATALIETLQPYHEASGFKDNRLWKLHMLDIIDKHRRIAINENEVNAFLPTGRIVPELQTAQLEDGFEVSFPSSVAPVEMRFEDKPRLRFGDKDLNLFVTVDELGEIHQYIAHDVLPQFQPFMV
jgi:hypothetical protein